MRVVLRNLSREVARAPLTELFRFGIARAAYDPSISGWIGAQDKEIPLPLDLTHNLDGLRHHVENLLVDRCTLPIHQEEA